MLVNNDADLRYNISGKVTNSGFGGLFNIGLSDSPAADGDFQVVACGTTTSIDTFPLAGPLGAGEEVCYQQTMTVPLAQNGLTDTITVTSNTKSDGTGTAITDSFTAQCPNKSVSPNIRVKKDCKSTVAVIGGQVVAKVEVFGNVCNIGDPGDGKLTNVVVDDLNESTSPNDPILSGVTLLEPADKNDPEATPGACVDYGLDPEITYIPSVANDANGDPTTDPSLVRFVDTVRATGKDIFGVDVQPHTDMAECPLCP